MKLAHRKNFAEVRNVKYPKSRFDLSHSHAGSYDWGYLYPIVAEEVSPGDTWNIGQQMVTKMMPTIAPVQHEINQFTHYYFVPYRLLDENWETFITGGPDGTDESTLGTWSPDTLDKVTGSLWDHYGLPMTSCAGVEPLMYLRQAYNFIWSEYYRDENLQDEIAYPYDANAYGSTTSGTFRLCKRAWEKDYFTASLPWQQRGVAPALPVTGILHALFDFNSDYLSLFYPHSTAAATSGQVEADRSGSALSAFGTPASGTVNDGNFRVDGKHGSVAIAADDLLSDSNTIDLANATTFDVADLRAAFQLQRWLERNARSGVRYTEFLYAHFQESPRDERLQRPEYIGGFKQQVTISEVLQVSETATTPQGTRTGIGSVYGGGHVGTYHAQEYGIIIGLMSIMPRSMYTQGVNRTWLRRTKYDFLFPEFVNLSEQAILTAEIFAGTDSAANQEIFGYQGRYDELRQRTSRAVGLMRVATSGLIHWNLSRKFATAPALNADFIEVEIQELKDRVFAVPSEPGFITTFGNILTVERALPMIAEPGLIDHI